MRCPGRLVKGVFFYPHIKHYGRKACDPNKPNYKVNRLTDIEKRLLVAKGEGWGGKDGLGVWAQQIQTGIYRMDKQQGPTEQQMELYSVSCDKPQWKGI